MEELIEEVIEEVVEAPEVIEEIIDPIIEEQPQLDPEEIITEDFGVICKQDGEVIAYGFWTGTRANNQRLEEWAEFGYKKTSDKYVQGYDGKWYIEGSEPSKPDEVVAKEKRLLRDDYLEKTDVYMLPDFPISDEERELYKQYRQYLRDLPESLSFPNVDVLTFEQWVGDNDGVQGQKTEVVDFID